MAFLLALLGFIVAGDVVELEPVRIAPTDVYGCNIWSGSNNDKQQYCEASPYCRWGGTSPNFKCFDDPCLRLIADGNTCPTDGIPMDAPVSANVGCKTLSVSTKVTGADCGDNTTVVDLCVQTGKLESIYNYCLYAQLRDGTCPASVCREFELDRGDHKLAKHCNKNTPITPPGGVTSGCNLLSTKEECGRVPKCYWKSDNCIKDPCFISEEDCGTTCANYDAYGNGSKPCKEVKLFKKNGGGAVTTYCVHSDNSDPNLCYLGNPGIGPDNSDDNGFTYPTLEINADGTLDGKPTCSTTAASCDNMGETCSVKLNKQGGLAGAYCGDEGHGAANILRIPSLFVVLLIALFSIFN